MANDYEGFIKLREERVARLRQTLYVLFPDPVDIVFEAGCGHGHFLTAFAEAFRNNPCVGIDLISRRIEKAKQKKTRRHLGHLHFMKASVEEWFMAAPAHVRMAKIFMLFPDPWPKKRHHKHRMLQISLLDEFARRSTQHTRFYFRSDDPGIFSWATEQVTHHPAWRILPDEHWPFEHQTFFESLASAHASFVASPGDPPQHGEL